MASDPVSANAAALMSRKPELVDEIAAAVTFGFIVAAVTGSALVDRVLDQRGPQGVTALGEVSVRLAEYMGAVDEFMEALPPEMENLTIPALSDLLEAVLEQFDQADRPFLSLYDEVVAATRGALSHLTTRSWTPQRVDIEPLLILTDRCAGVLDEVEASGAAGEFEQGFLEDEEGDKEDLSEGEADENEDEDAGPGPAQR